MSRLARRLAAVAAATAALAPASALRFFLRDRERACFSVSARPGGALRGYAAVENGRGSAKVALEIAAPDRSVFFDRHTATLGAFSVLTPASPDARGADDWDAYDDEDEAEAARYGAEAKYEACLTLTVEAGSGAPADARRAVTFRLYAAGHGEDGAEATGGGAVKDETVGNVSGALKTMFHEMQAMMRDLQRLQRREKKLVKRQSRTARVLWQSTALSIVVLCVISAFQYSHYKSYFTSKKLC